MYLFQKLKEMKTLLVDDDEWIRDSMTLFFEDEGCDLLAVDTAEEGLEKLKGQQYDVIIADYRLPGMDGLEFMSKIRHSHPNAVKLLITAYGSREVFSKASSLGVQGFIDKPFTIDTIQEALSRVIRKNEKQEK